MLQSVNGPSRGLTWQTPITEAVPHTVDKIRIKLSLRLGPSQEPDGRMQGMKMSTVDGISSPRHAGTDLASFPLEWYAPCPNRTSKSSFSSNNGRCLLPALLLTIISSTLGAAGFLAPLPLCLRLARWLG